VFSSKEIIDFSSSKETFLLSDLDESTENIPLPKIDFCVLSGYEQLLENPNKQSVKLVKTLQSLRKINLNRLISINASSVMDRIKSLYENKNTTILFINNDDADFKNVKLSDIYNKDSFVNIKLMNEILSDDLTKISNRHKSFELPVNVFHRSLLYSSSLDLFVSTVQISHCRTVNWSLFNQSEKLMTNYDPFLRPKNQISFLWKRLVGGSNIYYENNILVQSEYSNIILKIKSFTFNKNYKRECKEHSSKCVSNFPVLEELTDYQLFLCNSEFQELIYKTFNCTPFYSSLKNKHMNECPVKITLLIYETLIKFEKDLFNCEFSIGKSPIELLQTHHSKPYFNHVNDYFTGIDFRDVKLFEEKI
jgi:hypothetical protein